MADISNTIAEIDEQVALHRQRLGTVVAQIRTVLEEDLAHFVQRETKRAFLSHPEIAATLDDQRVAELKRAAETRGPDAAARIAHALEDGARWSVPVQPPADGPSLMAVEGVWSQVRTIEDDVRNLLDAFGLPGGDVCYKPPVYFVRGLYLPSQVEHFWKLSAELEAFEREKRDIAARAVRSRLESRWDDVE